MAANPQKENGYTTIANEIMEALAKTRIPGEARQMLDAIIRKTYGFNKKIDRIATSQLMELTGLKRNTIHRARKRLLYAKLITVYKNDDSQVLSYSFQKDYTKWLPVCKNAYSTTVPNNETDCMQKSAQTVPIIEAHKRNKDNIQKKYIRSGKPDLMAPIEYLNLKIKSNFDPKNKSNQDLVRARYNEGRTLEQFKTVIDKKAAQWLNDEKMMQYLRPSTLFNRTKFENYLNEPIGENVFYEQTRKEFNLK